MKKSSDLNQYFIRVNITEQDKIEKFFIDNSVDYRISNHYTTMSPTVLYNVLMDRSTELSMRLSLNVKDILKFERTTS